MIKAFRFADPTNYRRMLMHQNERHITAIILESEKREFDDTRRAARAVLQQTTFNKEKAMDFILTEPGALWLKLYAKYSSYQTIVATIRNDEDAYVAELINELVRIGDDAILDSKLTKSNLNEERRAKLNAFLLEATEKHPYHSHTSSIASPSELDWPPEEMSEKELEELAENVHSKILTIAIERLSAD